MNSDTRTKAQIQKKALGAWFRRERESKALSVSDVARSLNISRSALSQIEIGGLTYKTALKHAQALGWDLPPIKEVMEQAKDTEIQEIFETSYITSIPYLQLPNENLMHKEETVEVPNHWLDQFVPDTNPHKLAFRYAPVEPLTDDAFPNATLLLDKSINMLEGNGIYAITYNGVSMVRRFVFAGDGWDVCTRDEVEFKIPLAAMGDVTVHAKVIGRFLGFQAM